MEDRQLITEVPAEVNTLGGKALINSNGTSMPWTCPKCGTINGPQQKQCINKCITQEEAEKVTKTLLNG